MSYIKRWTVTQQDGKSLNLYYRTFELAKQNNPNCTIVEYVNNDYLAYIDMIINQAVDHRIDYKGRHSYKINIPCGVCWATLFYDKEDRSYFDGLKYQVINDQRYVEPVGWTVSNPQYFYAKFMKNNDYKMQVYSKRSYGQPKLPKPKELKGVSKCFSVKFGSKAAFQCFLENGNLWFKCTDYFSKPWQPPNDDSGKSTTYYLKKYFHQTKTEKFIYSDTWGEIVLRNEAWIKIVGFENQCEIQGVPNFPHNLFVQWAKTHNIDWTEMDLEWERMFESIVNEYKNLVRSNANEN